MIHIPVAKGILQYDSLFTLDAPVRNEHSKRLVLPDLVMLREISDKFRLRNILIFFNSSLFHDTYNVRLPNIITFQQIDLGAVYIFILLLRNGLLDLIFF